MNRDYRGLAAVLGVPLLVALGAVALGNRMLGPAMIWSPLEAGAGADGTTSGASMALGWLTMLVFWGAVLAGPVMLIRALARRGHGPSGTSAMDILRRQYEAGGITREEYERARRALRREPVERRGGA